MVLAARGAVVSTDNSFEMRVIGFLDDDYRLQGHLVNSKPVFSPMDLTDLIESKGVTHVLLAIPLPAAVVAMKSWKKLARTK